MAPPLLKAFQTYPVDGAITSTNLHDLTKWVESRIELILISNTNLFPTPYNAKSR